MSVQDDAATVESDPSKSISLSDNSDSYKTAKDSLSSLHRLLAKDGELSPGPALPHTVTTTVKQRVRTVEMKELGVTGTEALVEKPSHNICVENLLIDVDELDTTSPQPQSPFYSPQPVITPALPLYPAKHSSSQPPPPVEDSPVLLTVLTLTPAPTPPPPSAKQSPLPPLPPTPPPIRPNGLPPPKGVPIPIPTPSQRLDDQTVYITLSDHSPNIKPKLVHKKALWMSKRSKITRCEVTRSEATMRERNIFSKFSVCQ